MCRVGEGQKVLHFAVSISISVGGLNFGEILKQDLGHVTRTARRF
jgi:hypothetical protein